MTMREERVVICFRMCLFFSSMCVMLAAEKERGKPQDNAIKVAEQVRKRYKPGGPSR